MSSYIQYIKERFPIAPVLLFAGGYAALGVGVLKENVQPNALQHNFTFFAFTLIFAFFLLRQRVTDEFKDSNHDAHNFPTRPVPRGLISKRQLIILGIFSVTAEWLLVFLLGYKAVILYLPVFLYSLLMAKEFFIPNVIGKRFNIYLVSHELIFVLYGLFFINSVNLESITLNKLFYAIGILFTAPFSIEIVRKFSPRFDSEGKEVYDTYSTVWGRASAVLVLVSLMFVSGLLLTIIKSSVIPLIFCLLSIAGVIYFGRTSDKLVIVAGSINFLSLAVLSMILK